MDFQVSDRRFEPRFFGPAFALMRVTLRPGWTAQIMDLSRAGAQLQTHRPLRPGSRVHIRVVAAGKATVLAGSVLRCAVAAVHPQHGVIYRGGLRFEEPCVLVLETLDAGGHLACQPGAVGGR